MESHVNPESPGLNAGEHAPTSYADPSVGPVSELPDAAPFWSPEVTLLLVMKDGALAQSNAKGGKAALLARAAEAQHVLASWHGEWRTNVFTVSRKRCAAEAKARRQVPRLAFVDRDRLDHALVALTMK